MPATDEELLVVRIEAKLAQFENSMQRATRGANKAAGQIEGRFKSMQTTLGGIGKGLGPLLGVSIGVGALKQLAGAMADTVHAAAGLVDLADKIGITTDALQELRFQADQQGSSAEELDVALSQFSKRIGEAAAGSGTLLKILQANNIALRDQNGNLRPLAALLSDYADLIKNAANDQDRAVLATQAFGKAGDEMASVLRGGSAELETFAKKAHDANQVVGEDGVRALESFDDRLQELKGNWNTAWTEMTVIALEALENIGQAEHAVFDAFKAAFTGKFFESQRSDNASNRINQAFDVAGENIPKITIHPRPQTVIPNLGGGGGGSAAAIRAQRDSVADLVAELQEELRLVGATDTEQRVSNELRHAGADATAAQKAQIADLVTRIEEEAQAQQDLIDKLDEIRSAAGGALDAFTQSIENGEGAAAGLKAALVDILQTVIRIGEQQAIASLFGAQGTSGGGILGGIVGSLLGAGARAGPSIPSVRAARGGSPTIVQLVVTEGQLFEQRVSAISGNVAVQHVMRGNQAMLRKVRTSGAAWAAEDQARFA